MIVATDTSVILNLCFLKQEALLPVLFQRVLAPPEVQTEFRRLTLADDRFSGLVFPEYISVMAPDGIVESLQKTNRLQAGEIAAISLAVEQRVDAVLIDERAGRASAGALGLNTIGLLGVLLQARKSGRIPALLPLLDRLHHGARFWMAPMLRQQLLRLAGEMT